MGEGRANTWAVCMCPCRQWSSVCRPRCHQTSFGLPAVDVWRPLAAADAERFCLVWETKELVALNKTLITFLKNKVSLEQHMVSMMSFTAAIMHGGRGPRLLHVLVHNGPASARQPFREAALLGGHLMVPCPLHNNAAWCACYSHAGI